MGQSLDKEVKIQVLINSDAGEVFHEDGIRFSIRSKESGPHHKPHIHVDARHEALGVFSLIDGNQLTGNKFKKSDLKKIKDIILSHQEDLFRILERTY